MQPQHEEKNKKEWWRKAVVYQIYPRSFKDASGDGVGDIRGIIEKLDYLNDGTEQSLGVGAIWLSPIYTSPMKDFGYDVSDFYSVDLLFGTMDDFDELIKKSHARGIRVIMDFIPNHTSDEHPWFAESRSSRNNPKRDWYIWKDPKPDGSPPTNWLSVFGGPAWTKDEATGQYYLHHFLPEQPDLNWRNKEVRDEMLKVMNFWIHRGVDGFRTDAIAHLMEDKQFRDDPPNPNYVAGKMNPYDSLLHTNSQGTHDTLEAINSMCEVLGAHEDTFMISEVYMDVPGIVKFYKACEHHKLQAPFNFNLISLPWNAQAYKSFIDRFEKALSSDDWPNYVLGNHDQSRVASRLGQKRTRLAAILLFTLRGMPFIYYGAELGMEDVQIPQEKIQDPFGKRMPGFSRDPERTPMQWDGSVNAGFSTHTPWLPLEKNYQERNVAAEHADSKSMLALYRRLIHFRSRSDALLHGTYTPLTSGHGDVLAFMRETDKEKLLIVCNFSEREAQVKLEIGKASMVCMSSGEKEPGEMMDVSRLKLKPLEGYVFKL